MKLRRSLAWTRGNDFERAKRQINSVCDAITIDLEDSVMPSSKPAARRGALEMLTKWDFRGKERIVRINGRDAEYYKQDMAEVIALGLPDAIRLPKCETVDDVLLVDVDLSEIEKKNNLPENSIEIIAMIESPLGVRNVYEIASCCKRVTALSIGMEDLTADMEVERSYEADTTDLLYVRQKFVLDAKAAGVQAIDSGFNKLCPLEFNHSYNKLSSHMGFDGRSVRDGEQAVLANQYYRPSEKESDWSRRTVEAYRKGNEAGDSEVYVDGRHLCAAAYHKALKIMDKIKLIEEKEKQALR